MRANNETMVTMKKFEQFIFLFQEKILRWKLENGSQIFDILLNVLKDTRLGEF